MIEPVQVSDGKLVDPVDHPGVTGCHSIEPTAPAFATCGRAKFAPQVVKHLRQLRIFCRQGPLTYASRIRLHHAYYAVDPMRWHAGARARATRSCI
jgi:hypothetical protein